MLQSTWLPYVVTEKIIVKEYSCNDRESLQKSLNLHLVVDGGKVIFLVNGRVTYRLSNNKTLLMICCSISSDVAIVKTPKNQIWIPNGANALALLLTVSACRLQRETQTACLVLLFILRSDSLATGLDRMPSTRSVDKILTFACCGIKNKITRTQKADVRGSRRNTKILR